MAAVATEQAKVAARKTTYQAAAAAAAAEEDEPRGYTSAQLGIA
jgi:hypothetical protein